MELIDPDLASRGTSLGLIARTIVEGYRVGEHRSPLRGFAIEFAQHREYAPGDDVRHLDWKIHGKTNRFYIKQYEQDTNFIARLFVDGSESMAYGSGKVTKFDYAKVLAATMAYLVLVQRDAAALTIYDDGIRESVPRTDSMGKLAVIMDRLATFLPSRQTDSYRAAEEFLSGLGRRNIVIWISDFLGTADLLPQLLPKFRFKGCEVILMHVLDHAEIAFDFKGPWKFVGLEAAPTIQTIPSDIRKAYLEEVRIFTEKVRLAAETNGFHYLLADTSLPASQTVGGYLAFRNGIVAH